MSCECCIVDRAQQPVSSSCSTSCWLTSTHCFFSPCLQFHNEPGETGTYFDQNSRCSCSDPNHLCRCTALLGHGVAEMMALYPCLLPLHASLAYPLGFTIIATSCATSTACWIKNRCGEVNIHRHANALHPPQTLPMNVNELETHHPRNPALA